MNFFSISQLQQLSGVKAHTIRIWEQRYNALTPQRSEGNTRYYDAAQLRRLLNIVSLSNMDYKIADLCVMSDKQLFSLLDVLVQTKKLEDTTDEYFVSQLIAAGIYYDEAYFEKIFSNAVLRFGIRNTYVKVIYPMLWRVGMMWANDSLSSSQEHFISNVIRQKLFSAIDALPPPKTKAETWLLFLPENEFHEIGLLFAHYLIRQAGKKGIYLGSNVPIDTLSSAIREVIPDHILFFWVHNDFAENAQRLLQKLSERCGKAQIHISGNQILIDQLKLEKSMHWLKSIEDLEKELKTIV